MSTRGILLFCITLFISQAVFAQPRGKVYKSRTGWAHDFNHGSPGAPYKGIYAEFNERGYKTLRMQYNQQGKIVEQMRYYYVEGYKLVKLECYNGRNGDSLSWYKEFEYDEQGNNTSQIWHDGLGNITQKDYYHFNKYGFQSEEERFRPYGTFYEYVENKFDQLGRLLETEIFDNTGRRKAVSRYLYNEYGKKLEKTSRLSAGTQQRSTYQYDDRNELVSSYFYFNSNPVIFYKYQHEYW